jgi:hypothetical protein
VADMILLEDKFGTHDAATIIAKSCDKSNESGFILRLRQRMKEVKKQLKKIMRFTEESCKVYLQSSFKTTAKQLKKLIKGAPRPLSTPDPSTLTPVQSIFFYHIFLLVIFHCIF